MDARRYRCTPTRTLRLPANLALHECGPVQSGRRAVELQLVHDWGHRVVEPHAYGVGDERQELLRLYRDGSESQSGESFAGSC